MNTLTGFGPLLQAAQSGGAQAFAPFIMLALFFAIFYFLMIRPMKKKQKLHEAMLQGLKRGDKVITNGGIFGVIDRVKDTSFVVEIGDNVKIEVLKSAVAGLQSQPVEEIKQ